MSALNYIIYSYMKTRACRLLVIAAAPALVALLFAVSGVALRAQQEGPIVMPKVTVRGDAAETKHESWQYTRIEGFEVLSNGTESEARTLLRKFLHFRQALALAWPPADFHATAPATLILCGKGGKFDSFLPKRAAGPDTGIASVLLRSRDMAAIVVDLEAKSLLVANTDALTASANSAAAADAADAANQAAQVLGANSPPPALGPASDVQSGNVPHFLVNVDQQLYREYLHFVLSRAEPPPPAWVEEGLAQVFMRMEVTDREIIVGKLADPNEASALADTIEEQDFNVTLNHRNLLPLPELFSVAAGSPVALHPVGSTWSAECYAFVHWGLYGEKGAHQQAFLNFVARSSREPVTEQMFKECFKENYKSMLLDLRGYIQYTTYKSTEVRRMQHQKLPPIADFSFRAATQAEIGRIKGQAEVMAGHVDEGGEAMYNAYRLGERDPALLAALGLYRAQLGDADAAERFLDAAATAGVVRPDAYVALAKLRLAAGLAQPAGPDGRLTAEQLAGILRPLFTARKQPPASPEVYEEIATAWSHSAVPPTAANLAVLDEGLRLFYRHSDFLYQAAQLDLQYGFKSNAAELADIGVRVATNETTRQKFAALRATLPPASPAH